MKLWLPALFHFFDFFILHYTAAYCTLYIYGVSRCDFFTFFRVSEFIAWIFFLSGNLKPCQTKLLSSISDSKLWVYLKWSKPSVPGMKEGHIYILMYLQTHLCETLTIATSWKMPFFLYIKSGMWTLILKLRLARIQKV